MTDLELINDLSHYTTFEELLVAMPFFRDSGLLDKYFDGNKQIRRDTFYSMLSYLRNMRRVNDINFVNYLS